MSWKVCIFSDGSGPCLPPEAPRRPEGRLWAGDCFILFHVLCVYDCFILDAKSLFYANSLALRHI